MKLGVEGIASRRRGVADELSQCVVGFDELDGQW
jgi:hypothetical protein